MTNSDLTINYPPGPTRTERIENIRRGDVVAGIGIVTQDTFVDVDRRVSVVTERETLTGRLGETLQLEVSVTASNPPQVAVDLMAALQESFTRCKGCRDLAKSHDGDGCSARSATPHPCGCKLTRADVLAEHETSTTGSQSEEDAS